MSNRLNISKSRLSLNIIGILGSFLIMGVMVCIMYQLSNPTELVDNRAELRHENLSALKADNESILNNYAWINQEKKVIRMPIERAMEIVVKEWGEDPMTGMEKLIERYERLNPPSEPEPEDSEFE
ncbi:MAG TPA: hypothetical protein EYQ50_19080 [Verrucomicrobiales bacterium]|nr:hypothetical protein [Verrucomicrobiales bacterium]HIL68401.1 hypothetical protein [Verrucomicrobiota bacterium]